MKKIIIIIYLLINWINYASSQDTIKNNNQGFNRFSYEFDIISFIVPKIKFDYVSTKSSNSLSYGINTECYFNFNKTWSVSTGLGFYREKFDFEINYEKQQIYPDGFHIENTVYNSQNDIFIFYIPLNINYIKQIKNTNISFFIKVGIYKENRWINKYKTSTYISDLTDNTVKESGTNKSFSLSFKDLVQSYFTFNNFNGFSESLSIGVSYPLSKKINICGSIFDQICDVYPDNLYYMKSNLIGIKIGLKY